MNRSLCAALLGLLTVLLMLPLAACQRRQATPGPRPAAVLVTNTVRRTLPVVVRGIGTVEASATVAIKAQVSGPVRTVHFHAGQDVNQGDLLFSIDPRPFAATLRAAAAGAQRASNNLVRARDLLAQNTISPQEFDDAQAGDQEAQALLDRARLDLEYCQIRAPIAGRTGDVLVDAGNLVKANDVPVLVVLNQLTPIDVRFAVPELYLADLRRFQAIAPLQVRATPVQGAGAPEEGAVSFIDNTVEAATGTIRLKATFANAPRHLWPGQFVEVQLVLTEQTDAVVVPAEAVQTGQQGPFVFVVKADQTAEVRPVTVGRSFENLTVIERGLEAGETIVTDGQLRVVPGGQVAIKTGLGTP